MSSVCPTCGLSFEDKGSGSACACARVEASEPFPLDEFAPEMAPRPRVPAGEPPPVLRPRPSLVAVTASTPPSQGGAAADLAALAEPVALELRSATERPRPRLPTGIRLVIGRRRKPLPPPRRPALTEPVVTPPVEAPAPRNTDPPAATEEPARPTRSHPSLAAQARLFDEPTAPSAPPPSPPPPAADVPRADAVASLLGAFAPSPQASPAAPEAPEGAVASTAIAPRPASLPLSPRVDRPVRAERMRIKDEQARRQPEAEPRRPRRPQGPPLGRRLADAAAGVGAAAQRVGQVIAGPQAMLALGLLALAAIIVIAPAFAAPLLACAGLLLARREESSGSSPSAHSVQLITLGLAASALLATTGFLLDAGRLAGPVEWIARPSLVALPSGLAGLALSAAASLLLARRFRAPALAAVSVPLLLVALGQAVAAGGTGLVLASAALGAASAAAARRALRADSMRLAGSAWAAAAAITAIGAALATTRMPAHPFSLGIALLALAGSAASGAARLSRSYEEGARSRARLVAVASGIAGAVALVVLARSLGLATGTALALAPLAGLGHHLLLRFKERRHHSRLDAPWLAVDGRVLAMLGTVAGLAGALLGTGRLALGATVLLASCAVLASVDLDLTRRPAGRLVAPLLAWACVASLALALGLPATWLPALAAVALAGLVAISGLAARRSWRPAMGLPWTWPVLAGSGACLVAALGACASGGWMAGGIGVVAAALVPWTLRLQPPSPDSVAMPAAPASRSLTFALLALAPAAPLVALGELRWTGPLFAAEALIAWALSRTRAEALVPLGALLLASAGMLPLLASRAGFVPGALMLLGWCVAGALECEFASRHVTRGTREWSAGVSVGAGLALVAWLAAAADAAAITLLVAAVLLQAVDRLLSDAVLARSLRGGAAIAWLAGVGLAALQAAAEPLAASLLLAGAALGALLIAALRGNQEPAMAAGLAGSAALGAACLHVGISPAKHPAVYLAPVAAFLVAWSVLQAWRGGRSRSVLGLGLFVLAGSVLLESHLPAAPQLLRIVAAALAATIIAGGVVTRQRTPVLAGAAILALESAWLLGEGVVLVARHPLPGITVIAAIAVVAAAAVAHVAWRAGGRAPLLLAWTSDLARLREAWSRWAP